MREYAFDIKLQTVARVMAKSEDEARAAIRAELDAYDLYSETTAKNGAIIRLTEASVCGSSGSLFEVDGETVADTGFDYIATRDGEVLKGTVYADDEDMAREKAFDEIAKAFRMKEERKHCDSDDFEAELDSFTFE